ncbi:hypothetical protein FA13DRAFT_1708911 [Coprinellus micaceus]|uniref:Uncharacterized protein n=1 Tax=Coprinellus micaceus TaxID=71717 RepID=A0A4Y7TAL4_COPMI|nr:hypothetical protein FA13DRAFT_1709675 [Coprinellus micaceus]TEB32303.1 hypothetical protein FA13DRAFT_1708911 [Coprinellus micaceus]
MPDVLGPRIRLLASPDHTRAEEAIFDLDSYAQRGILRLIQAAAYFPEEAVRERVLVAAAQLVSPFSVYYVTQYNLDAMRAIAYMRGIFIWLTASDLHFGTRPPIAPYAVAMCVLCEERLRAIAFAQMLIFFLDLYADGSDRRPTFEMVNLCFRFDAVGVVAVMFFDVRFERAFQLALEDAAEGNPGACVHDGRAVTFWPPYETHATVPGSFDALLQRTRFAHFPTNYTSAKSNLQRPLHRQLGK